MSTEDDCVCPPDDVKPTKCDCDRTKNMWFEGENADKGVGICLLDTWTDEQIIYSLEHNPWAARDLLKITTDPRLRQLAETVSLLSSETEGDRDHRELNKPGQAGAIPFYAFFRGQPPFNH